MDSYARPSNVDGARLQNVIVVHSVVGRGTEDDPVRSILEYWSLEGELLARRDHWRERPGQPGGPGTPLGGGEPMQPPPGTSWPES